MLFLSSKRLRKSRMGLHGPVNRKDLLLRNHNLYIVEVSYTVKWHQLDPSNHVYFLRNKEVTAFIDRIFSHDNLCSYNSQEIVLGKIN
jgi:hypothetical protein